MSLKNVYFIAQIFLLLFFLLMTSIQPLKAKRIYQEEKKDIDVTLYIRQKIISDMHYLISHTSIENENIHQYLKEHVFKKKKQLRYPPASTQKSVILTFDDGPAPKAALKSILATLKRYHIHAEFYLLGQEISANKKSVRYISKLGHKIQNHSWSHINLAKASQKSIYKELQRTQNIIFKATGVRATKIRPPYGAGGWGKKKDRELSYVAKKLSLKIKNWDIDTVDWKKPSGINKRKLRRIKHQLDAQKNKKNLNVLMHVKASTARDLPRFIQQLQSWGYTFARPI